MRNWHIIFEWNKITSDTDVLNCVKGQCIEFCTLPITNRIPQDKKYKIRDSLIIDAEIQKLLDKGVVFCRHEIGEYLSPIFVTEKKKDGSFRMILNLKNLNRHVQYQHFKMYSVWTAIRLMTTNCYMASIDLKDAFISQFLL